MKIYFHAQFRWSPSLEEFYWRAFKDLGHDLTCDIFDDADISLVFKWARNAREITAMNGVKVLIYPDPIETNPRYFQSIKQYFDHIFLCDDKSHIESREKLHELRFAYDPSVHYPVHAEKNIDCLFIGTKHEGREWMKDVPIITRYGGEWEDSRKVSIEEFRELYSRAKVTVNEHTEGKCCQLSNMRDFEAPAMRTFMLSDHSPLDSVVTYDGITDLREKINYYLNHSKERKRIVEECLEEVKGETYEKRAREMIETIS